MPFSLKEVQKNLGPSIRPFIFGVVVVLLFFKWKEMVDVLLDVLNYSPKKFEITQIGRYSVAIEANKSFGDLFFGIIGSLIAFFSWTASKSSAKSAEFASKMSLLALEDLRPALTLDYKNEGTIILTNEGNFDAKEIKVYLKTDKNSSFVVFRMETDYLGTKQSTFDIKVGMNDVTAVLVTYKNVASSMLYVASLVVASGPRKMAIGSPLSPVDKRLFEDVLNYTSLSKQIIDRDFQEEVLIEKILS